MHCYSQGVNQKTPSHSPGTYKILLVPGKESRIVRLVIRSSDETAIRVSAQSFGCGVSRW